MLYFDTTYLFRLYYRDLGWDAVRALAARESIACSVIGEAECAGAIHRKLREGFIDQREFAMLTSEFLSASHAGAIKWIPLSPQIINRVVEGYRTLPPAISLRSADAIHLATARELGFPEIYSNDTRMLQAAAHFHLAGRNVF